MRTGFAIVVTLEARMSGAGPEGSLEALINFSNEESISFECPPAWPRFSSESVAAS